MTGGGCPLRERRRRASLGFLPLQRLRNRKSTHPGFPAPGSFPSQRFSRSQGVAPSETLAGLLHPANAHGVPLRRLPSIRRSRPPKGPSSIAFARSRPFDTAQAPHVQVGRAYSDPPRRAFVRTHQAELQRSDLRSPSSLFRPESLPREAWPLGVPVLHPDSRTRLEIGFPIPSARPERPSTRRCTSERTRGRNVVPSGSPRRSLQRSGAG
jgi:hypothetical protein